MANLKLMCDEIFGEENFESLISWRRRHNQPNDKSKMIAKVSEQILVYSRNSEQLMNKKAFNGVPLTDNRISEYNNPDNDPMGDWTTNPWKAAINFFTHKEFGSNQEGSTELALDYLILKEY